jgi:hypothetical protein
MNSLPFFRTLERSLPPFLPYVPIYTYATPRFSNKSLSLITQTAQVASQQGKYLGAKFNKLARRAPTLVENGLTVETVEDTITKPFRYLHLGSLAYIGNAAVFDLGRTSFMGGLLAMYAWRSVYWSEQVSARTRSLLMIDWIIRYAFFLDAIIGCRTVLTLACSCLSGAYGAVTFQNFECSFRFRFLLSLSTMYRNMDNG